MVRRKTRPQGTPQRAALRGGVRGQLISSSDTEPVTSEEQVTRSSKQLDSNKTPTPLIKRKRKLKSGFKALKEIKKYQKSTRLLIPRLPFHRLVQEILFSFTRGTRVERIQRLAVEALQEAAEMVIVQLFEDSMLCAVHAKRVTLLQKDIRLVRQLGGHLFLGASR